MKTCGTALLAIFFVFSGYVFGQEPILASLPLTNAIQYIYAEKYTTAQIILDSLIAAQPQNPAPRFYRGVIPWTQSTLLENKAYYDSLLSLRLEKVIQFTDDLIKQDPENAEAYFYRGGAHGFLGTMYARQGKNWQTGIHAWRGIGDLEQAAKLNPELIDVYYGFGLYHVVAGNQPTVIRFLQRLLPIPFGRPSRGIRYLKKAAAEGTYSPIPAQAALAFTYLHLEINYPDAVTILENLLKQYPTSTEFLSMMVNALLGCELTQPRGDWEKIIHYTYRLDRIVRQKKEKLSPWWQNKLIFIRGYAAYGQDDFLTAIPLLEGYSHYYHEHGGSYLLGLSELTLGKIYDLRGQSDFAIHKYKRALKADSKGNVKKLADKFLREPFREKTAETEIIGYYTKVPKRP